MEGDGTPEKIVFQVSTRLRRGSIKAMYMRLKKKMIGGRERCRKLQNTTAWTTSGEKKGGGMKEIPEKKVSKTGQKQGKPFEDGLVEWQRN